MSFDRPRDNKLNLKKVAVIGGTGFIGYHIVNDLIQRNYDVTVVTRNPPHEIPAEWKGCVIFSKLDAQKATEEEFKAALTGHQGLVFAAGGDPGDKEFREKNVDAVKRTITGARKAGCDRAVILGSYFTYFACQDSKFGEDLKSKHSYVDSRIEQAKVARESGGSDVAVSVIEIPWVFGVTPGRTSLWKGLVKWSNSRFPLFAPDGGTAAVSVETVARVAAAALQTRSNKNIPVAEGNFTWAELLNKIARTRRTVHRIQNVEMSVIGLMGNVFNTLTRQQDTGLTPSHFLSKVFTRELFIDLSKCRKMEKELGLTGDVGEATCRMDASFTATIDSCFPPAKQPQINFFKHVKYRDYQELEKTTISPIKRKQLPNLARQTELAAESKVELFAKSPGAALEFFKAKTSVGIQMFRYKDPRAIITADSAASQSPAPAKCLAP